MCKKTEKKINKRELIRHQSQTVTSCEVGISEQGGKKNHAISVILKTHYDI